ncbi:MAG: carbohydrate-binding domain-containing protein [Oscillospiraceae bacterium]|nr:carbohydrate-binding domain-containing protein [Oscillospiraceae bacterium]
MRKARRMTAAVLCGTVLLTAFPVNSVLAADEKSEPEVMKCVVTMNGTEITSSNDSVAIDGTKVTISASGAYEFTGTLDDGQIYVKIADTKTDTETVKLFLKNVTIHGKSGPAIMIDNAKNTSINLVDGTENFIYDGDGSGYTKDIPAAIFSKDDLTIKAGGEAGDGKLVVEAAKQHGIHTNDDLKITGGNIKVKTDAEDGIRGKASVTIKGGKIDVNAEGDGIKSTKGTVTIEDGKIEVKAGKDAIQGETNVMIKGGDIKANGDRGITNVGAAPKKTDDDEETPKAVTGITITGGTVFATATKDELKEDQTEADLKDNTFKVNPNSTQAVLLLTTSETQLKDQRVVLKNKATTAEIINKNPNKKFDYILISSPEMKVDETYQLSINDAEAENGTVKLTGNITTAENVINKNPRTAKQGDSYDINGDGSVDVSDVVLLCRFLIADPDAKVTDAMVARMDIDQNGSIEPNDATKILLRIARIE